MSFQSNAFQNNAYQVYLFVTNAAARLKKRLRRNARTKARADELAEKYKETLATEIAPLERIEQLVKPYIKEATAGDYVSLPVPEAIDFEKMAADTKTRKQFLQVAKLLAEQEEEEMTLIILLANL